MPPTVRGRYELDAPAMRTLKELEAQGVRTREEFERLGKQIDKIGDRSDMERLNRYKANLRELGTVSGETARDVQGDWEKTTRVIEAESKKQRRDVDALIERMEVLGATRAQPQVDVDGIAAANAELDQLERRLTRFGRRRPTARVGITSRGLPAGPGAPGPVGPAVTGANRGGGGRGGGQGGALRSVGFGPLNLSSKGGTALTLAALPAARSLLGAAGAVAGSAGSAALGAGGLALAGYGTAAVGGGLTYAAAKPVAAEIGEVKKAQDALTQSVALYGRTSTQVKSAQDKLNLALSQAPVGTQALLREWRGLSAYWQRATGDSQQNLVSASRTGVGALRDLAPVAARGSAITTGAISRESRGLRRFANAPQVRRGIVSGAEMFDENLPYIRRDVQAIVEAWLNFLRAARPGFKEVNRDVTGFLENWRDGSRDIRGTREDFDHMVENLRTWVRLGGSAYRLTKDLLGAGAPEGTTLIERLTQQLDTWDEKVRRNPAQVRGWFHDTTTSAIELARAIGRIAHALDELGHDLGPLLDHFSELLSLAGDLGLLTPGAGALAFGAYRGLRGGRDAGGGGGAGGGAIGFLGGGGGGGRGGRGARPGRGAGPAGGPGQSRAGQLLYGSGFRGGAPVSEVGQRRGVAGAALGGAGLAARGAARGFLPVAGAFALLDAYGFNGPASDKFDAAASSLTLGLIPRPHEFGPGEVQQKVYDAIQRSAATGQSAQTSLPGGKYPTYNLRAPFTGAGAANPLAGRGALPGFRRGEFTGGGAKLGELRTTAAGLAERELDAVKRLASARGDDKKRIEGEAQAYRDLLNQYRAVIAARREEANQRSRRRADSITRDLGKAYDIRSKGKGGEDAAMDYTVNRVLDLQRGMRPAGAKVLAQNTLAWAHQQAKDNPKLLDEYEKLKKGVEKKFSNMGQTVLVVNDRIFKDSKTAWANIRSSITSEAEKARQEASESFTKLQKAAVQALVDMGFNRSQARAIVSAQEKGGSQGRVAAGIAAGGAQPGGVATRDTSLGGSGRGNATGGRVPNPGGKYQHSLEDSVVAGNNLVAPDELIVGRHTERRINKRLLQFGTTLGREVQFEGREHARPFRGKDGPDSGIMPGLATGGRSRRGLGDVGAFGTAAAGSLATTGASGDLSAMVRMANSIDAQRFPYRWGGGHNSNFTGPYDCSGAVSAVLHAGGALGSPLTSGAFMSYGEAGPGEVSLYANAGHVYMMMGGRAFGTSTSNPAGGAGWFEGGPRPGFTVRHIPVSGDAAALGGMLAAGAPGGLAQIGALSAPRSRLRGIPGALSNAASRGMAAGMTQSVNRRLQASGAGPGGGLTTAGGKYDKASLAALWTQAGGPASAANIMAAIALAESGGNPQARNPSGASGLWQILGNPFPGNAFDPMTNARMAVSKYQSQGLRAWEVFTQGSYRRYLATGGRAQRSPAEYMRFAGAFAKGGSFVTNGPTGFVAGDGMSRREEVSVKPMRPGRRRATGRATGGGLPGINVNFNAPVTVGSDADLKKLQAAVADAVGAELLRYLDQDVEDKDALDG